MPGRRKALRSDPFARREARRYDSPIASREFIQSLLRERAAPLTFDELAKALKLRTPAERTALEKRLGAMSRAGQLVCNRRGGYMCVDEREMLRGRISAHPDGYGFLVPDEGGEDVYLAPREMRAALHGDRAVVRVTGVDRRGRAEGGIVEMLERAHETVVGRLHREGGFVYVVPADRRIHQDILIANDKTGGARANQIVVARIQEQPSTHSQPIGVVEEVLGERGKPGMEVEIAVRSHGIPAEWPRPVVTQAARVPKTLSRQALAGRRDLRDLPFVTIDGEDAKDFDDAVYCAPRGDGWRLLVAIADVAHYVVDGSALDVEARKRATSVYFPGQVIPMLPEALSNGLCSLNPEADRLVLVCDMSVAADGNVQRSAFSEAVIRSHARLTYSEVDAWLFRSRRGAGSAPPALREPLAHLAGVYAALARARGTRGALDFESNEVRFEFDRRGHVAAVVPYQRNDAHRLIEECMVTANVCAARYLKRRKLPALYRNHAGPGADKLTDLRLFLRELGLHLGGGEQPAPGDYAELIGHTRERDDAFLIHTMLLRSLAQAVYQPRCQGHFGLALEMYAHFTSPIRRYPDLVVHRAIKQSLQAAAPEVPFAAMEELGVHCSYTERRAEEATRDVANRLKCEFMRDHVGEQFDGVISGVAPFGVFVQLHDLHVEGLIHVTVLPRDYYHFDPVGQRLEGERGGQRFRLGDTLRVRVVGVTPEEGKIDFELAAKPRQAGHAGRRKGVRGRRR